jgi:hypothetical protein
MEMFNAHRRDIMDFDNYMDLKKPGFGGPSSAIALRDERGRKINKNPKLADYQRTVERDPAFSNQVYNPTYKAMTHDLVYKQENKKPFKYTDPYRTAVPVIEYDPTSEGKSYESFKRFVNEEKSLSEIEDELRSYEAGANPGEEGEEDAEMKAMLAELPTEFGQPSKEDLKWLKNIQAGANPSDDYFGYGMNPSEEPAMMDAGMYPEESYSEDEYDEEEDSEEPNWDEFEAGFFPESWKDKVEDVVDYLGDEWGDD